MDDGLKQRLIGAFVLLAIAVIFIPVMFDRERMAPVDTRTQIPAAPHIEPLVIETPTPTPLPEVVEATIEPAPAAAEMYVPDETEEVSPEPEPIGVDQKGVPKGWVLQVASFKSVEHAKGLRDKLIAADFTSYVRSVNTSKGEMTRVFVGPTIDKEDLLAQKERVEKEFKVQTLLLKFKP